jgi:uncharacterized protein YhfF
VTGAQADAPWWADLPRESIGIGPALIDELLELVLAGTKTASCGALSMYNGVIPKAGDRCVLLNGAGEPRCVIEDLEVVVQRFDEVTEAFALLEGEGDYATWRAAHEGFFAEHGGFSPDMTVVCERFRVVEVLTRGLHHG